MDYSLIIFVLTGALLGVASAQTHQYYFVSTPLNWTSAQSFCRQDYTDLVTIENTADVDAVINTSLTYTGLVWIGLHDDFINSWKWSLSDSSFYGEGQTTFRNWYLNQPNNLNGQQYCVTLLSGSPFFGTWDDVDCSLERHFVCYNGTTNGSPSYVVSGTSLNWTEAQKFCRENYVDLASVRNQTDNTIIANLAAGDFVWIGLSRQKVWSDGSNSSFQFWVNGQPNSGPEQCVAAAMNDSGRWSDEDCALSLPFICYAPMVTSSTCVETGCPSGMECLSNNAVVQCIDPCDNYTVLNDDWRSVNNTNNTTLHCDQHINWEGWYRLYLGQSSAQIPEQCIEEQRCGTHHPLWINGSHPTQTNEIVTRTVCNAWVGSCCYFTSHTIQVKLCYGYYYVYKLAQPSTCSLAYCTAPHNAEDFRASGQNETSITLQWNKLNNISSFIFQFNGTETNISAPDGPGVITHTVSSLTAGTKYTFTLIYVSHGVRSNIIQLTAITAPSNPESLKPLNQTETSITLQWNKANNTNFVLELTGSETSITAPDGDGAVTHTVSSLTAGSKYTFTLFSVFENIRSSGVSITAATAPVNAEGFGSSAQTETSITLQWNKVNNTNFVLQFNDTETNISAPDGAGAVTHTVSSLTAGTKYTFTLFSVFENIRSSGVSITAATGPHFVFGINVRLESLTRLSETELEDAVAELFRKYGVPPEVSISVRSVKP
ncbi:uncharacterized protein LOC108242854 isoform X3 [Kryptolebias marmoratus]|uniref:uncharacterized protein LOC108242854 isoform X3 n=1 Tax=Kryptolebias marmoratus TaxID=37003 RepID=UPI0007F91460|nr:uncharacterized protein LOC108242854 isoform X3 [Kryptolebias marmoratus]